MPRYFLEIAYMGTEFAGWQRQKHTVAVQNVIETALSKVIGRQIKTSGASRTDAAAHALRNYAHFDLEHKLPQRFLQRLNWLLPEGVRVRAVYSVPQEAHARFSVLTRTYMYVVALRDNPLWHRHSYIYPFRHGIDLTLLNRCAHLLTHHTCYKSFARADPQTGEFTCCVRYARWRLWRGSFLLFVIEANRFLRGMVRALVGTMLKVSRGSMGMEQFEALLSGSVSSGVDFSVPAHGLYLVRVNYPFKLAPLKIESLHRTARVCKST